jgi:1-acyl-sn-glycerol-3-phosphate acyltransferase
LRRNACKRRWSAQLLEMLGIRIATDLAPDQLAGGLLVCNHISFIDVFVINALLPSAFVSKDDVAGWPLIGWLSRRNGTVFIARGSRRAAHRTQVQMVELLRAGERLAIFPEGTSTVGVEVLPFHAALLQSAIDADAAVYALALSYRDREGRHSSAPAYTDEVDVLSCLRRILGSGGLTANLTLAACYPAPHSDRRQLAHRSHQSIAASLRQAAFVI